MPVNIYDIEVNDPDRPHGRKNREIFTVVVDERIPDDIVSVFEQYGARNSLFEDAKISTFIKVERQFAHLFNPALSPESLRSNQHDENSKDLVFAYGNTRFVQELIVLTERKDFRVQGEACIWGRTDKALWGERHGADYVDVDGQVIRSGLPDQRIESHPSAKGEILVQVVKLPLRHPDDPSTVVGIQGFYWYVTGKGASGRQKEIQKSLNELLRPREVLNENPLPVFMKDASLRFTYANQAYLDDLKSIHRKMKRDVKSLYDIIGWTDKDLFHEDDAKQYENDDLLIIRGKRPEIRKPEEHGGRLVKVIKKPIVRKDSADDEPKIVGLQGIFWYQPGSHRARIDWRTEPPRLYVHDGKKEHCCEIARQKPWYLFDILLHDLGSLVTYDEIVKRGLVIDKANTRDERQTLMAHKYQLLHTHLPDALLKLQVDVNFVIEVEESVGYCMTLEDKSQSTS